MFAVPSGMDADEALSSISVSLLLLIPINRAHQQHLVMGAVSTRFSRLRKNNPLFPGDRS